jgi:hypothetical protein
MNARLPLSQSQDSLLKANENTAYIYFLNYKIKYACCKQMQTFQNCVTAEVRSQYVRSSRSRSLVFICFQISLVSREIARLCHQHAGPEGALRGRLCSPRQAPLSRVRPGKPLRHQAVGREPLVPARIPLHHPGR